MQEANVIRERRVIESLRDRDRFLGSRRVGRLGLDRSAKQDRQREPNENCGAAARAARFEGKRGDSRMVL